MVVLRRRTLLFLVRLRRMRLVGLRRIRLVGRVLLMLVRRVWNLVILPLLRIRCNVRKVRLCRILRVMWVGLIVWWRLRLLRMRFRL